MNRPFGILVLVILVIWFVPGRAQTLEDMNQFRWQRKKPVIDSIKIEGNHYFSDGKIKSVLFSKRTNIIRAIKADRARRIQRETIMRDTSEVKYLYLSEGFLGIRIKENFVPLPPDSNAMVKIRIDEGRQFFYGTTNFTGHYNRGMFQSDFTKIMKDFKIGNPEKPVNPFNLRQAAYDIKSVLANKGFPYAIAEFNIDTSLSHNFGDITFHIESDSLVHFGNVLITGASNFRPSLVQRELAFKTGDVYRRDDIIESQKRLLNTGYYLTLRLSSMDPDTVSMMKRLNPEFILSLKEREPHYVSIKTGAAQDSIKDLIWSLSGSWGKRNFLRSRLLELTAQTSFVIFSEWRLMEHSYRIRITEPWFLGIRMPLTLTAQFEPGVRSLLQPYRKQTWFISITTTWYVNDRLKTVTGLQFENINIYGLSGEAEEQLRQEEGISVRRKLYINFVRDTRNSIFIPSRGSVTSLRYDYVGGFMGGDDSFYLLEGSWSRYQKIWPGWISATRFKGGFVQETRDGKPVPTDDRFYIGGANTVRGFSEGELSPESDLGNPVGADIIIIMNQEFRFPIIGKLWGSLFCDAGNGYRYRNDIKWNNLAVSYGAGIQFISPAGPIRLDYARRVRVKGIEPGYRYHFTILYAF
nr:BamA/TamA family outer membrane protein [candidate division Zixibacteria bacterium]